mgnify:FL=1|jgi:hypothetical protein
MLQASATCLQFGPVAGTTRSIMAPTSMWLQAAPYDPNPSERLER